VVGNASFCLLHTFTLHVRRNRFRPHLWGRKRFLLPVTYFPVTSWSRIYILYGVWNASFCLLHTFRLTLPSVCYILSDERFLLPVTYFPTKIKNIYTLWGRKRIACYILSDDSSIPLTLRVTCYILSDESRIPFCSTSNGFENRIYERGYLGNY